MAVMAAHLFRRLPAELLGTALPALFGAGSVGEALLVGLDEPRPHLRPVRHEHAVRRIDILGGLLAYDMVARPGREVSE